MGRTIERFPDWEYHLGCFLKEVVNRPRHLSYPTIHDRDWDCGLFVCEAILRMTGRPVHTWATCYSNWRELARLMGNAEKFDQYIAEKMGEAGGQPIPVKKSRKGDVVVLRLPQAKRALSIRIGEHCAAPGKKGLEYAPVSLGVGAYRIG